MRYVLAILFLVVTIGALVAIKWAQIGSLIAFGEQAVAAGPPPEYVGTAKATTEQMQETLREVGTVTSEQGVQISAEVPGIVTKIEFESGQTVKKGDVLVRLDTGVERAQLAEAQSRRRLAETALGRTRSLVQTGAESKSVLDADASAYETATAQVRALQAQLERKTIRAPFTGKLGLREVNLGQYLNPGDRITSLETADAVYVDFTVPQQRLAEIRRDMPVRIVRPEPGSKSLEGELEAFDPTLNRNTRTLKVRAKVPNVDGTLQPGMFVEVHLPMGEPRLAVMVPATAVVHASYGDSVFVVEDKPADEPGMRTTEDGATIRVARQHFVRTGAAKGDFVAVDKGIAEGQEVVVAGAFKLRNGVPVVVDNDVVAEAKLEPDVENR